MKLTRAGWILLFASCAVVVTWIWWRSALLPRDVESVIGLRGEKHVLLRAGSPAFAENSSRLRISPEQAYERVKEWQQKQNEGRSIYGVFIIDTRDYFFALSGVPLRASMVGVTVDGETGEVKPARYRGSVPASATPTLR